MLTMKNMSFKKKAAVPSGYTDGEYAVGTACFTIVDKERKKVLDEGSTLRPLETNKSRCPFYLAHSKDDELVPFSQTKILYDALLGAGYDVQMAVIEGASHTQGLTTEVLHAALDFVAESCK